MSKSKLRLAGAKLRVAARLVESKVSGGALRGQVKKQLGLNRIWEARLDAHEPPMALPSLAPRAPRGERGGEGHE